MIVYLSDWYYGVALLQKQDIAARRVGKLVVMTELHDKMRADYNAGALKLKNWIDAKIKELGDRTIDNTLAGAKARLDKFYDYKVPIMKTNIHICRPRRRVMLLFNIWTFLLCSTI